ncbi:glycosyltransferase [Candidatus Roizmanbacteria bacterium]|nr:glycosyltransferase [Candidatus Roizmanbacteria bacterium]
MNIAIIANLYKELSGNASGGTELFSFLLAEELASRNSIHHIDVYGVGKNNFRSPKISFINVLETEISSFIDSNSILIDIVKDRPYLSDELQNNLIAKTYKLLTLKNYKIIHNNSTSSLFHSLAYLQAFETMQTPIITTLHTNLSSPSIIIPYLLNLIKSNSNYFFVPIADHQVRYAKKHSLNIPLTAPIYNGIKIYEYSYNENTPQKSYGLWIGRISKKHNKGLKEALLTTNALDIPFTVVITIDDKKFYDEEIQPLIHKNVQLYTTSITPEKKAELYKNAGYFIYPIMWEEPFGLIFLEAMVSGTPVIAYAKGAVPEIIKDGETGFIVNSSEDDVRGDFIIKKTGIEGLCEGVKRIHDMTEKEYKIMRNACHNHVEKNFTIQHMVDEYEELYTNIINHGKIV